MGRLRVFAIGKRLLCSVFQHCFKAWLKLLEQSVLHASSSSYPFRGREDDAWRAQAAARRLVGPSWAIAVSLAELAKHFDKKSSY